MSHPKPMKGAKFLNFRCTDCENCCTETIVPITHHDVKRLVEGSNELAEYFVEFSGEDDFDDGGTGLAWIELEEGKRVMVLRKQGPTDCCYFLRNKRCSVYEHRPVTCRVYPFALRFTALGDVRSIAVMDAVACPYSLDGCLDLPTLVKDWNWDDKQDEEYHALIADFNKSKGSRKRADLLAFFGLSAQTLTPPKFPYTPENK
jgi:Fe-S-cluster containining protein